MLDIIIDEITNCLIEEILEQKFRLIGKNAQNQLPSKVVKAGILNGIKYQGSLLLMNCLFKAMIRFKAGFHLHSAKIMLKLIMQNLLHITLVRMDNISVLAATWSLLPVRQV